MRGTKAKAMRREDPSRPNPGRLGGGSGKEAVRNAPSRFSVRKMKRQHKRKNRG